MKDKIKKLIKNPKFLYSFCLAALIVAIFCAVSSPTVISVAKSDRLLPIYSVDRDDKYVSLTFDAAWGNEDTQTLIDILGEHDIKATFFVVGNWAERYPESVKALQDAGHEVMTHSDDHAHFSQLTGQQIIANINAGCDKIEAVTGVRPNLFRCPYGEYDDHVIKTMNEMGFYTIQWSVDSLDWKGIGADEIYSRVTKNVKSGDIVLFHNAAEHTPEALPDIIDFLLDNGFTPVPVSELLLEGDYEMDHTGKMCRVGEA